jgi:toxin ParE1/3/4
MSDRLYKISEKAKEDLTGIWIYTYEKWSREQADRYYDLIISEIEFIAENFSTARSMSYIKEGYRMSKVKSHMIFYKLGSDQVVEVIRILHERMDIKSRLKD